MNGVFNLIVGSVCLGASFSAMAENIKVVLTSKNEHKILAVSGAFQGRFPNDEIELVSYRTISGVPEEPIGQKT